MALFVLRVALTLMTSAVTWREEASCILLPPVEIGYCVLSSEVVVVVVVVIIIIIIIVLSHSLQYPKSRLRMRQEVSASTPMS
jgi:hypothetical protein